MTSLSFRMVNQFFDRPAVVNAIDRAKRKQLSKAGAFVRTTARRSIRPAPKPRKRAKVGGVRPPSNSSRPGQPPRLHTRGRRNLRMIFFAWDAPRQSVVIGPAMFQAVNGAIVPNVLEHGGRSYIKANRKKKRPAKRIHVSPRPFMLPALKAEAPKFPDLFANSVKP